MDCKYPNCTECEFSDCVMENENIVMNADGLLIGVRR